MKLSPEWNGLCCASIDYFTHVSSYEIKKDFPELVNSLQNDIVIYFVLVCILPKFPLGTAKIQLRRIQWYSETDVQVWSRKIPWNFTTMFLRRYMLLSYFFK